MKLLEFKMLSKNTFSGVLLIMGIFLFASCTHKMAFENSSVVPAARGYVEMKKDKNKNNVVSVHLTNLAEANRLTPPRQTYVVWILTNDDKMKNVGQIKSFNKNLSASFQTVSSFVPSKIIITAEDDGAVQFPSSQIVLTSTNLR